MTQQEAGAILGISQSTYSRLETGKSQHWSPKQRAGAAQIIGILAEAVDLILAGDDPAAEMRNLTAKQGQRFDHLDAELAKVSAAVTLVVAVEHLLELEAGQ